MKKERKREREEDWKKDIQQRVRRYDILKVSTLNGEVVSQEVIGQGYDMIIDDITALSIGAYYGDDVESEISYHEYYDDRRTELLIGVASDGEKIVSFVPSTEAMFTEPERDLAMKIAKNIVNRYYRSFGINQFEIEQEEYQIRQDLEERQKTWKWKK